MANNQTEAIANYVRDVMAEKGLSGYDVARAARGGITQRYVSKIINKEFNNLGDDKKRALAAGLGVPVSEIYALVNNSNTDSLSGKISHYVDELPESVQEDVLLIVKSLHQKYKK